MVNQDILQIPLFRLNYLRGSGCQKHLVMVELIIPESVRLIVPAH